MCLSRICKTTALNKYIEENEDQRGYITVYKIVQLVKYVGYKYSALFMNSRYKVGMNYAKSGKILYANKTYKAGFHFFTYEHDATRYRRKYYGTPKFKVIKCRIHKSWITTLGYEYSAYYNRQRTVVVTNKAYMPSPNNKKVVII